MIRLTKRVITIVCLAIFMMVILFLSVSNYQLKKKISAYMNKEQIVDAKLVKELQYRQKEAYNQWFYLCEKGDKLHSETGKEIKTYNEDPTEASLSRIDTLKNQAIDMFHVEVALLMDYIEYLENKLSELTKGKFKASRRIREK